MSEIIPEALLRSDNEDFGISAREDIKLTLMTRRRYRWELECDVPTATQSENTILRFEELRPYFRPLDELLLLPDRQTGHRHSTSEFEIQPHND